MKVKLICKKKDCKSKKGLAHPTFFAWPAGEHKERGCCGPAEIMCNVLVCQEHQDHFEKNHREEMAHQINEGAKAKGLPPCDMSTLICEWTFV